MKKRIPSILAAVALIAFTSCANVQPSGDVLSVDDPSGAPSTSQSASADNEASEPPDVAQESESETWVEIRRTSYKSDGSISSITEFEYDSFGNLIKQTRDGGAGGWTEYEYDATNRLIKETSFKNDSSISSWSEYEYDTSGHCIRKNSHNAVRDGFQNPWTEYEYDADGHCTKEIPFNEDGSVSGTWTEYQYDSEGRMVKRLLYTSSNTEPSYIEESYYNEAGDAVKDILFDSAGNITSWKEYVLDESGNCEILYYDKNGEIKGRGVNNYDAARNLIEAIDYKGDGSLNSRYVFDYELLENEIGTR